MFVKIFQENCFFAEGKNNSSIVPIKEDNHGTIVFEVVKAEKVKEGRSTFVVHIDYLV